MMKNDEVTQRQLRKGAFPCRQDLLSVETAGSQPIFTPLHPARNGLPVCSVPCGPFSLIEGKDTCVPGYDFWPET
jgi:hypothetical protein